MDIEQLNSIVKLMVENGLSEIQVETEGLKVSMKRPSAVEAVPSVPAPVPQSVPAPVPAAAPAAVLPAKSSSLPDNADKVITSPIVGTFYRSTAPGSEAFVKVGTHVDEESTVCIVEAMKVMNEIKAEKSGVIKEVLVENGQPVEYGQPLFVLE